MRYCVTFLEGIALLRCCLIRGWWDQISVEAKTSPFVFLVTSSPFVGCPAEKLGGMPSRLFISPFLPLWTNFNCVILIQSTYSHFDPRYHTDKHSETRHMVDRPMSDSRLLHALPWPPCCFSEDDEQGHLMLLPSGLRRATKGGVSKERDIRTDLVTRHSQHCVYQWRTKGARITTPWLVKWAECIFAALI